jgi:hypothetical protein
VAWRAFHDTIALSPTLAGLSDFGERTFVRTVCCAVDPWGRFWNDPGKIRAKAMPRLDVSDADVAAAIEECVRAGLVEIYMADGQTYLHVVRFDQYQPRDALRTRVGQSRFPDPPQKPLQMTVPHERENRDRDGEGDGDGEQGFEGALASGSPTAVASLLRQLPDSHTLSEHLDLAAISERLKDSDKNTPAVLSTFLRRGLPEAAFHNALDALRERKEREGPALTSEVRYFVATLKRMEEEGQYA